MPTASRYADDPILATAFSGPRHKLLRKKQVAALLGISEGTVDYRLAKNRLPGPVRAGGRLLRWRLGDIKDYVDGLPQKLLGTAASVAGRWPDDLNEDKLDRIGMYAAPMRGGRRKKVEDEGWSLAAWTAAAVVHGIQLPERWLLNIAVMRTLPDGSQQITPTLGFLDLFAMLDADALGEKAPKDWMPPTMAEQAKLARKR